MRLVVLFSLLNETMSKEKIQLRESGADESGWILGDGSYEPVDHPKDWHHSDILYAQYETEMQDMEDEDMGIEFAEELAYGEGGIKVTAGVNWNDPSRRHFFGVWSEPSKQALNTLIGLVQASKANEFTFGWSTTIGDEETSQLNKEEALVFLSGKAP
jgi:hypothetical protein